MEVLLLLVGGLLLAPEFGFNGHSDFIELHLFALWFSFTLLNNICIFIESKAFFQLITGPSVC